MLLASGPVQPGLVAAFLLPQATLKSHSDHCHPFPRALLLSCVGGSMSQQCSLLYLVYLLGLHLSHANYDPESQQSHHDLLIQWDLGLHLTPPVVNPTDTKLPVLCLTKLCP